jgi:hypothetical protein
VQEWATTLAGAASGLSAKASELVGMTLRADSYTVSKSHSTDEYVDANRWLARVNVRGGLVEARGLTVSVARARGRRADGSGST